MKTATIEKVGNGYIIERVQPSKVRMIAGDELELAEVIGELWDEADALAGVVRGTDIADVQDRMRDASRAALAVASSMPGDEWPASLTPDPSPTPGRGEEKPGPLETVRMPVAEDGTEYPRCYQGEAANHFEVECPVHGRKRMERRGVHWACAGGSNKTPCRVMVPAAVLGKVIAASA